MKLSDLHRVIGLSKDLVSAKSSLEALGRCDDVIITIVMPSDADVTLSADRKNIREWLLTKITQLVEELSALGVEVDR